MVAEEGVGDFFNRLLERRDARSAGVAGAPGFIRAIDEGLHVRARLGRAAALAASLAVGAREEGELVAEIAASLDLVGGRAGVFHARRALAQVAERAIV